MNMLDVRHRDVNLQPFGKRRLIVARRHGAGGVLQARGIFEFRGCGGGCDGTQAGTGAFDYVGGIAHGGVIANR